MRVVLEMVAGATPGKSFEDRMVEHLTRFFPRLCEVVGEKMVREMIQDGIRKAAGYGIDSEYDVCRFIDLMFELGNDFDNRLKLPWVRPILTDTSLHAATKIARIHEELRKPTS